MQRHCRHEGEPVDCRRDIGHGRAVCLLNLRQPRSELQGDFIAGRQSLQSGKIRIKDDRRDAGALRGKPPSGSVTSAGFKRDMKGAPLPFRALYGFSKR